MCSVPRSHVAPPRLAGMMMRSVVMTGHGDCDWVRVSQRRPRRQPSRSSSTLSNQSWVEWVGQVQQATQVGVVAPDHPAPPAVPAFPALVPIVLRLVRSLDRHAEVIGLLLRQPRQLHAEVIEVKPRNLLIEVLREDVDLLLVLGAIGIQLELSDRLVRK